MADIFSFLHLPDTQGHVADGVPTDGANVDAAAVVANGETQLGDSVSSGTSQVAEKQAKIKKLRAAAHQAHKRQHFTKGMFWDSAVVKTKVLLPIFAVSLLLSAFAPEAFTSLSVVFVGLGTRISYEAVSSFLNLINKTPQPIAAAKTPKNSNQLGIQSFVDYRKKVDVKTSAEVAIGLIDSIHKMVISQQIAIMGLCGLVMTAGPPVLTNLLLTIEDAGLHLAKKMREMRPGNPLNRFIIKKDLHNRWGDWLEDGTTRSFDVMPWIGVGAKVVTGGRVFAFGTPLEAIYSKHTQGLLQKYSAWEFTGVAVGITTAVVYHELVKPLTEGYNIPSHKALLVALSLSDSPAGLGRRQTPTYQAGRYKALNAEHNSKILTLTGMPARPLAFTGGQLAINPGQHL